MSQPQTPLSPEHVPFRDLGGGTVLIDTGFVRPGFDGAYLLIEQGRAAFIDCGTSHSVPRLLETLASFGLQVSDVDALILSHVHLDHAGGAGQLIQQLPHARLIVHPRGARHMADPSKLWAGATAVYGEEVMRRDYGGLLPIAPERIIEAAEGYRFSLHGRELHFLDTPGHARHHVAVHDVSRRQCFTGDTFGLSYREFDTAAGAFMLPTTTPVQFDPPALHASIDRIMALSPQRLLLTHYGPVTANASLALQLHRQIDAMVALAETEAHATDRHERLYHGLAQLYREALRQHGWQGSEPECMRLLGNDIELNAQGLGVWLDQRATA
ncbi:MBL fold metallo-hydrolase [Frateuria aurantia]